MTVEKNIFQRGSSVLGQDYREYSGGHVLKQFKSDYRMPIRHLIKSDSIAKKSKSE